MDSKQISTNKITDIVVSINDFLIDPDTVSGGIYMCQNGGVGLLAKSAMKEEKYILKKFFGYIEAIPSNESYDYRYYYEDLLLPPILIDHLLDNDTDENIIRKAKTRINKTAKWMDKNGILALVDITFHHEISNNYRKPNTGNLKIIKSLSQNYVVHLLGNCNRNAMDKLIDKKVFECVNGNIITSSDLKELKCSISKRYDIYDKFLNKYNIDPSGCLFIETHQGHINALNEYGKAKGADINTILYNPADRKSFVKELSDRLGFSLIPNITKPAEPCNIETVGEFDINQSQTNELLLDRRVGSTIFDTFIKDNNIYEQLVDNHGDMFCTCMHNNIITVISLDEYKLAKTNTDY